MQVFISSENGVCPPGAALLDSCTSHFVSRSADDFEHMIDTPARITGATGSSNNGRIGILRENILGLKTGIFYPDLQVERLVSTPILNSMGWTCILSATNSSSQFSSASTSSSTTIDQDSRGILRRGTVEIPVINRKGALPYVENVFEDKSKVDPVTCFVTKVRLHQRRCHFHVAGSRPCICEECLLAKAPKKSHPSVRSEHYKSKIPFNALSVDFFGRITPTSVRGHKFGFLGKDDASKFGFGIPIPFKASGPSCLESIVRQLRLYTGKHDLVRYVRSDNEPVLKGETWSETLIKLLIVETHSPPYTPQMNAQIERFVRSIKDAIRAVLTFVDKTLWCYALEHVVHIWNLIPRLQNDGTAKAPTDVLNSLCANSMRRPAADKLQHAKRFGCLAFFKVHPASTLPALQGRRYRGVHLGFCRDSSCYLIGTFMVDGRNTQSGNVRWTVTETEDVQFHEDILVSDINQLKPESQWISVRVSTLEEMYDDKSSGLRADHPCHRQLQSQLSFADDSTDLHDVSVPRVSLAGLETPVEAHASAESTKRDDAADENVQRPENAAGQQMIAEHAKEDVVAESAHQNFLDKSLGFNERENAKSKKRKREETTTQTNDDTAKRKGRGADKKQRKRRTKEEMRIARDEAASFYADIADTDAFLLDEEVLELEVCLSFLSLAEALASDDAPRWREALTKERLKLESFQCWRRLTPDEEKMWKNGDIKATPMMIIVSRKRCGTYKARAVALGNRWSSSEPFTAYSSTISATAQRALLAHCASTGSYLQAFDVTNAYIRALIDRLVIVKLPKEWIEEVGDNGLRTLQRALYGLPISGRLWAKTFSSHLNSEGWTECADAPNLWKKTVTTKAGQTATVFISVYVDDCLCCSELEDAARETIEAIFTRFDGTMIEADSISFEGVTYSRWDILGCDVLYNRELRRLKFCMTRFIDKMKARYNITEGKRIATPAFEESALYNPHSPPADFNFRAAVGSLQWAATAARPDVQFATSTLARAAGNTCTQAMARAAIRVIRYLVHTKFDGLTYSPSQESKFVGRLHEILEHHENVETKVKIGDLHTFSDASFASTFLHMKSVAGSIVFFKSFPIAWRSKAMDMRMYSTSEAEFCACAETLKFSFGIRELRSFLTGEYPDEKYDPVWVDNRTALITAKHAKTDISDIRAKSRHYALRHLRVADDADRLAFCPTKDMRADPLTKFPAIEGLRELCGGVAFLIVCGAITA